MFQHATMCKDHTCTNGLISQFNFPIIFTIKYCSIQGSRKCIKSLWTGTSWNFINYHPLFYSHQLFCIIKSFMSVTKKCMRLNLKLTSNQSKHCRWTDETIPDQLKMLYFTPQMPFRNDIYMHLLKCKLHLHKFCNL